jgi:protein-L-isoaspartate(D-aspartate) O-methyltransferase
MRMQTAEADRERMVRALGPLPPAVAEAMRRVPRHAFVPAEYRELAYADEPVPLPYGAATVSAPHMVALMLEEARLRPGDSVLEVGAGFGYLAAAVAELVGPSGRVTAMEIEPGLAREAERRLRANGYADRVVVLTGDGREGAPARAPFDRILISCATSEISPVWLEQLAPLGLLLAPVGDAWEQTLVRVTQGPSGPTTEPLVACRFVPLRGENRRARSRIYRP